MYFFSSTIHNLLLIAFSFAICAASIPLAARVARKQGLVDRPHGRKKHDGDIPLVGGIAIVLSMILLIPLYNPGWIVVLSYLLLCGLGVLDDLRDLSPRLKFLGQFLAVALVVGLGGDIIYSIGALTGLSPVELTGLSAIIFSVLCTIGVINSINMIDGADGLSGGIIVISLLALLLLAIGANDTSNATGISLLLGMVLAFIAFNLGLFGRPLKIFLGDAGSMVLGLLLTVYIIRLSQQGAAPLSPVVAGWIFGLPLIDTVSLMIRRVQSKKSPFAAGRDHLHHTLIDSGMSTRSAVLTMLSMHSILVVVGLALNSVPELQALLFWVFVGLVLLYHFFGKAGVEWLCNMQQKRVTLRSKISVTTE